MQGESTKRCTKCGEEKPLTDYYEYNGSRWGRCKACVLAHQKARRAAHPEVHRTSGRRWYEQNRERKLAENRAWRVAHPEKIREYTRASAQRHPETRRARQKRNYAAHPERYRAMKAVYLAIKRGEIVRPSACQACGAEGGRIICHHHDYSRPLSVIFVCVPCHNRHHHAGANNIVVVRPRLTPMRGLPRLPDSQHP